MPLLRRMAPLVLVVALVTGCGSSGVRPAAWAKAVCTALNPWRATLAALTDQTKQQLTSSTTAVQAKQKLVTLLDGAATASETARQNVADAGRPDVDHGDDIAASFVASLRRARDAYAHARATVAGLDAGRPDAFYSAVATAFEKLQTEYAASALDTGKVASAPLRKAFNEVPECH